jgi:hypothetical protein
LLCKNFRCAAMEVGRVNKSVKPAVRKRFHGDNLTTKHTKHTKEFADSGDPFRAERGLSQAAALPGASTSLESFTITLRVGDCCELRQLALRGVP